MPWFSGEKLLSQETSVIEPEEHSPRFQGVGQVENRLDHTECIPAAGPIDRAKNIHDYFNERKRSLGTLVGEMTEHFGSTDRIVAHLNDMFGKFLVS